MQTTIAPTMNLQQNPPSPPEYPACDEIRALLVERELPISRDCRGGFRQITIAPAMNRQQNPPSPPEYPDRRVC